MKERTIQKNTQQRHRDQSKRGRTTLLPRKNPGPQLDYWCETKKPAQEEKEKKEGLLYPASNLGTYQGSDCHVPCVKVGLILPRIITENTT